MNLVNNLLISIYSGNAKILILVNLKKNPQKKI